ncbi:Mobile element protein [Escherichia coli]|nr:Mobile element protein [Escherichia coli]
MRHRLSLLAQQVPVVQADGWIVNQNDQKKQNPPKRVKCGCVEDA